MLKLCADGYRIRTAKHYRIVTYDGQTFWTLPKHDNIELGHIRSMVRHLGRNRKCASEYILQLSTTALPIFLLPVNLAARAMAGAIGHHSL